MKNEIRNRRGFEPDFYAPETSDSATVAERCEMEHDWCLLMISRSPRIQAALEKAKESFDPRSSAGQSRHLFCRMLLGEVPFDGETGYATMARVMEVLAIATVGTEVVA